MGERLQRYYRLTKPGIVYGNAFTLIAGAILAVSVARVFHLPAFVAVIIGTSLTIASACVVNNVMDRNIDRRMQRTKQRSLVTGEMNVRVAVGYGVILGLLGFALLAIWTNWLTVMLGIVAYVFYVILYGITKRTTEHGTLVGSVAGALPPVAGYTAMTNRLDLAVLIIFLLLVCWQMVHFYAIAIYRRQEYKAANVPILTVTRGNRAALAQMVAYAAGFFWVNLLLSFVGYTHWVYAIVMGCVSIWWLVVCLRASTHKEGKDLDGYARRIFFVSLIVNLVMCVMIATGAYLP